MVTYFQPASMLDSVRYRLTPEKRHMAMEAARDGNLLGECISEGGNQTTCWWRILCIHSIPCSSPLVQRYTTEVVYDNRDFEVAEIRSKMQRMTVNNPSANETHTINEVQQAVQTLDIARTGDAAVAPTRSREVQTDTRLPFKDTRGSLTWSVVGGSKGVASGIMNTAAGSYTEAVLEHDGSRRIMQFSNFEVDAEWHQLQRAIFNERYGVNTFGSEAADTTSGDDDG
jgi:hypothetical protein